MTDRRVFLQALVAAAGVPAVEAEAAARQAVRSVREVHRQPLPAPFDGLEAAYVEVTIPPGEKSTAHRHPGFVLGYVLEGEFLFGTDGAAPRTVKAGEAFYEPPGAVHSTSESARPDRAAKILAIIVAERGKPLTVPAK